MGSGQWAVASGKWAVASGKWQVGSGLWPEASGGSGRWPRGTEAQRPRGQEAQRPRGQEAQRPRGTAQRPRGTEASASDQLVLELRLVREKRGVLAFSSGTEVVPRMEARQCQYIFLSVFLGLCYHSCGSK